MREATEDAQALTLLNYADSLNQHLDPAQVYARTGRSCIYIIDSKGIILHNNQVGRLGVLISNCPRLCTTG